MNRKRWLGGLVGLGMLTCFVAGCDDGEGDALTPEEAAAIAGLIGKASVGPLLGQAVGQLPPNGPTASSDHAGGVKEYDFDKPCSESGSVNLSGTADFEFGAGGATVRIEGTIALDDCAEKTDDGVTYTLNGSIDHVVDAAISFSGAVIRVELDGSATGSVTWSNEDDGGSGVCEVDVTLDVTVTVDKEAGSWEVEGGMTGTVCGISVEAEAKSWLKKVWDVF